MPRFRVLASSHTEDGVKYEKGAVVETERELDVLYKNKFKRLGQGVGAKPKLPRDHDDRLNQAGGKQGDKPLASQPKKVADAIAAGGRGKNKGDRPPIDYEEEDDEVEDDDLEDEDTTKVNKVDEEGEGDDEDEDAPALGENVTEQFPKAGPAEVKVFKKGRTYVVVEEEDEEKILNPEPLTSKAAVEKFIQENKNRE